MNCTETLRVKNIDYEILMNLHEAEILSLSVYLPVCVCVYL